MGFILFKSGFIMDQKGIKVFMKSLLQIYYITFSENLVKTLGGEYVTKLFLIPLMLSIRLPNENYIIFHSLRTLHKLDFSPTYIIFTIPNALYFCLSIISNTIMKIEKNAKKPEFKECSEITWKINFLFFASFLGSIFMSDLLIK